MININHKAEWFQSADAVAEFGKLTLLEERVIFIQAFLERTTDELTENKLLEYEREQARKNNFRLALFLADAIYGSDLPYAQYPALIDVKQNPFMKDWKDNKYGLRLMHHVLDYILCEKESKKLRGNQAGTSFKKSLMSEYAELGSEEFGDDAFDQLPDTAIFDMEPAVRSMKLKLMCLFEE